ncbi:MAG: glycogen/starch synthase [Candidatus Nanohaloarchaea archaeon]
MSADNFIEVSYEVANKVGGIHQVLKSKAETMKRQYGEDYYTIGYYDEEKAKTEFAPRKCPKFGGAVKELEEEGIEVHCGVWRVPGQPKCLLIDPSGMEKSVDDIKQEMWDEHEVDSMNAGEDFDDPVKWSYAVGKLIGAAEEAMEGSTVVQLHEWLSGPAMLNYEASTVFTTHATVLGRTLSNADFDLESAVSQGSIDQSLAEQHGVKAKHQVEKMAAENADIFTTVSKNTGEEAEAVLGVEPDVILPNGFNVDDFPNLEELSFQHKEEKEKVKQFLQAFFEPYYDIDLENDPRILFTSGRYEYHNKGVDILIDALSKLNEREGDPFYFFILVPTSTKGPSPEVLENMSLYQELEDYVEGLMPEIRAQLLNALTSDRDPGETIEELLGQDESLIESLRDSFHEKRDKNPPVSAFDLSYPGDQIMDALWENGLRNRESDRVKIIFYPTYLSVGDRLMSMGYNEFIKASSAGIFPSYYEPWGYTPVETAANGALAVTTDMAGFGQYLQEKTAESERTGIKILERKDRDDETAAENLADIISEFVSYPRTEITERKHNARRLAQLTSWDRLGENYFEAHRKALER